MISLQFERPNDCLRQADLCRERRVAVALCVRG
jgi:hypothetical protein